MTLFVFIAIFVIAIIAFVVTDRNKGFYEDRKKDLANRMFGVKEPEADDRHHLGYIPSGQTELVCWLTANEFPYHCTAFIEAHDDENDGHRFFTGFVYIKRLD